jgi:hypothetical protein
MRPGKIFRKQRFVWCTRYDHNNWGGAGMGPPGFAEFSSVASTLPEHGRFVGLADNAVFERSGALDRRSGLEIVFLGIGCTVGAANFPAKLKARQSGNRVGLVGTVFVPFGCVTFFRKDDKPSIYVGRTDRYPIALIRIMIVNSHRGPTLID